MSVLKVESDNIFRHVVMRDGSVYSTDSMAQVDYKIYDGRYGTVIVHKTLGNGIEKIKNAEDDLLEIKVAKEDLDFKAGTYWHKVQITDINGSVLIPSLDAQINIE